MAKGEIFVDTKQINKVSIELQSLQKQMPAAASAAINRTLEHINTKLARLVTAEYAIKSSDVRKTLKRNKASKSNMSASIVSKGHTLSMAHFPFTPKEPGTKKSVKVKIKKNEGKKSINTNPAAFVQVMSNSLNVFKRVGKERKPVTVIRTLSIPQMISNEKVIKEIQESANKKLAERIDHEIKYRLDKIKVK